MLNWLSPEEVARTSPEQLGIAILRMLTTLEAVDCGWWGGHNFTVDYLAAARPGSSSITTVTTGAELLQRNGPVAVRLGEAWAWLDRQGYIAPDSGQTPGITVPSADRAWSKPAGSHAG